MNLTFQNAQKFMQERDLYGWLLRDYFDANPILWKVLGGRAQNVTRPCWVFIPDEGRPSVLAHQVDAGRFRELFGDTPEEELPDLRTFGSRDEMIRILRTLAPPGTRIAMEYSPEGQLPRVGRVDAGSVELIRSFGTEVVSSGDILQFATERWTDSQLESHRFAAQRLTQVAKGTFEFIRDNINWKLTEHDLAEYMRGRFERLSLTTEDGPVVAVNANSSDPHYEPTVDRARIIRRGSWLLIDLWARKSGEPNAIYSDITWTAYLGAKVPDEQRRVFDAVVAARDAAIEFVDRSLSKGDEIQGWQVDRVARDVMRTHDLAEYFVHRLGHSLGTSVHSNGVNLDDWETRDTRLLLPGLGVTVEPGAYLGEFGVRSEVDLYLTERGAEVTTEPQTEVAILTV